MTRRVAMLLAVAPLALTACATDPDRRTLAELRSVAADVQEVQVTDGLDRAMAGYRAYLEETPESARTPEAMRRLADLQIERDFGILGDGTPVELPAPEPRADVSASRRSNDEAGAVQGMADLSEPEDDFQQRAAGEQAVAATGTADAPALPAGASAGEGQPAGPSEAIELYQRILATYPYYPHNDQVLYQMSRAYDEIGMTEDAMRVMERLIAEYPDSRYIDEVQFRRGEYFFTRRQYLEAEAAYQAVTAMGRGSSFYELALYKLGWTLFKQDFYEEALHEFIALLDYRVSIGYDFDQQNEEADERRVADTFRVISLSFSNLGPPEVVQEYFAENGHRSFEDRIYGNLGEFYFDKLRYNDAAKVYTAFIEQNALHRVAPQFSMRVVEIYGAAGFPMLVVQAKKDFANSYGLGAEYWLHFDIAERPEVVSFLKSNLEDLANHYHAMYQDELLADEQQENYREAQQWYRAFLASFPGEEDTPAVHYQLADLQFEAGDFAPAALEYERIAYEYPLHEQSAAAGYAAVYAHRERQKAALEAPDQVRREAVESSLRFAETFPGHEHAAMVLGAAADDLYEMQQFERARESGHALLERYPDAGAPLRRSAWIVVAHSSFDLEDYAAAELAYSSVLALTGAEDETRPDFIDNLAAAIYKQGELANAREDYRAAADHFLRIRTATPTSTIRAAAEYDAGAALIRLEDWAMAAAVLEDFRREYPEHELNREAGKQIAHVYREDGQVTRAAAEYERVSAEADDPELAREALLLAGELYEGAAAWDQALEVYLRYVEQFPHPIELAVETRHKIATRYQELAELPAYHAQLEAIVAIDAAAGEERTARTRYLAAQSGLVLAEQVYLRFDDVKLVQPFERSLQEKQRRMDAALAAFDSLVAYEVGDVTAAATFYIAEVYYGFSQALLDSERPADLGPEELADYEMVIEEEAFPFEERAIEVHEKNLELLSAGVFNGWVERSLDKLAALMPGRYAKFELSTGFLASLDVYSYRSPAAPPPDAVAEPGAPPPAAPQAPEETGETGETGATGETSP
ncbi:tetratricopeptide repeat protein [Thioalkalivibrio sp. XN279]|uniref:tetratricopeptide repeat protein n=1 Tax=Thioalkalivibrio sp. XN279 TaxID=2714953 RepID=UPI00140BF36F|nr:tetratricopeptide repeat protein [Thioalkalivibrio sp. XN279]NHA14236.1 tetratricopeptide repeat protein [Thioalkalivibrio sp. XN279]